MHHSLLRTGVVDAHRRRPGPSRPRATTVDAVSSASPAHRKSWPAAPSGFFEVEAAGLRWLGEAQPRGGARVVEVRDVGAGHIDLARLHPARPTEEAAEALGRGLAVTHAAGAPAFGSPRPAGPVTPGSGARRRATSRHRRGASSTPSSGCGPSCAGPSTGGTSTPPGPAPSTASATGWRPAPSTTTGPRRASTATCGRATSSSPRTAPSSSTPPRTAGTVSPTSRCSPSSAARGWAASAPRTRRPQALPAGGARLVGLHQAPPLAVHAASHGPAYAAEARRHGPDVRVRRGRRRAHAVLSSEHLVGYALPVPP